MRMTGAEHVVHMGVKGLEHLDIGAKITLKRTFQKLGGRMWIRFNYWYAHTSTAMNVQVPSDIGKFLTSWEIIKFSPTTLLHS